MPQYKLTYSVETPLRGIRDVTFTHGPFTVTLCLANPLDEGRIAAYAIAEGKNWWDANAIAMEDAFGPVLDGLSLHSKAPAMLQDLCGVVKAEGGITRRAVVIESSTEYHPVSLDEVAIQEVQDALNGGRLDLPAFRWLRYSHRSLPVLERFVFAWLAFENFCGVKRVLRQCAHCHEELPPLSSTDRERAFQIIQTREPQLTREEIEKAYKGWWNGLPSPVLHGGRRLNSEMRRTMQAAIERFRPAVEDLAQRDVGYHRAYPGVRSNDGVFQTNLHHFIEFTCSPETGEFADLPPVPVFPNGSGEPYENKDVTLLNFDDAKEW